jgi:hypothetical protein
MERSFLNILFAMAAAAAFALGGCQSAGGEISVISSAPIAPGATYAWKEASAQEGAKEDPRVDNDIIRGRIKAAVDGNLAARGFQRVEPSQAQYLVSYHVQLQNRTEYEYDSWIIRPIDFVKSTTMLDLTDKASGRLVWRATSQKRVDQYDETQESLDAMFADMVATLPDTATAARLAARP